MHHENASLRATISRQSQKIGRIENELRKNELLLKDQGDLQSTVEKQREKIVQYQGEIEETKLHMARLEELVHQVQEQSMKEHVTATPSVSMIEYPGIHETLVSPFITWVITCMSFTISQFFSFGGCGEKALCRIALWDVITAVKRDKFAKLSKVLENWDCILHCLKLITNKLLV